MCADTCKDAQRNDHFIKNKHHCKSFLLLSNIFTPFFTHFLILYLNSLSYIHSPAQRRYLKLYR